VSLGDLAHRLAHLDLAATRAAALASAAETIAEAVRESGTPEASIEVAADGDTAVIGLTDETARHREHGTAGVPPRPFLSSIASEHAEAAAGAIGAAVAEAIRNAV
jgi:hypothetical protein